MFSLQLFSFPTCQLHATWHIPPLYAAAQDVRCPFSRCDSLPSAATFCTLINSVVRSSEGLVIRIDKLLGCILMGAISPLCRSHGYKISCVTPSTLPSVFSPSSFPFTSQPSGFYYWTMSCQPTVCSAHRQKQALYQLPLTNAKWLLSLD